MLQFDSDGSGSLDFPEFLSLIAKIQKGLAHHIFTIPDSLYICYGRRWIINFSVALLT